MWSSFHYLDLYGKLGTVPMGDDKQTEDHLTQYFLTHKGRDCARRYTGSS